MSSLLTDKEPESFVQYVRKLFENQTVIILWNLYHLVCDTFSAAFKVSLFTQLLSVQYYIDAASLGDCAYNAACHLLEESEPQSGWFKAHESIFKTIDLHCNMQTCQTVCDSECENYPYAEVRNLTEACSNYRNQPFLDGCTVSFHYSMFCVMAYFALFSIICEGIMVGLATFIALQDIPMDAEKLDYWRLRNPVWSALCILLRPPLFFKRFIAKRAIFPPTGPDGDDSVPQFMYFGFCLFKCIGVDGTYFAASLISCIVAQSPFGIALSCMSGINLLAALLLGYGRQFMADLKETN